MEFYLYKAYTKQPVDLCFGKCYFPVTNQTKGNIKVHPRLRIIKLYVTIKCA